MSIPVPHPVNLDYGSALTLGSLFEQRQTIEEKYLAFLTFSTPPPYIRLTEIPDFTTRQKNAMLTMIKKQLNFSGISMNDEMYSSTGVDMINDACDIIVDRTRGISPRFFYPKLLTTVSQTLEAGKADYHLQSEWGIIEPELISIVDIRDVTSSPYRNITYLNPDKFFSRFPYDSKHSGLPVYYTHDDDGIISFGPTPYDERTMSFQYYHKHPRLKNSYDEHQFPVNLLPVSAACFLFCKKFYYKDEAKFFEELLNQMIMDVISGDKGNPQ